MKLDDIKRIVYHHMTVYLSIDTHAISLHIHPISKSINHNYTKDGVNYILHGEWSINSLRLKKEDVLLLKFKLHSSLFLAWRLKA